MSLTQQLADLSNQNKANIPPDALEVMRKAGEQLAASGIADRGLREGGSTPEFALPNALGKTVALKDLLAQGPVVLNFYRGAWCPYYNLELRAFQEALPEINSLGASLAAISPQTPDKSLSTREKNDLGFEVLSDVGNQVARKFGLVFQVPEEVRPIYKSFGIDLPEHNGDETFELPIPATYVVDTAGCIRKAFVDIDYTKRLDPVEVLDALRNLKTNA